MGRSLNEDVSSQFQARSIYTHYIFGFALSFRTVFMADKSYLLNNRFFDNWNKIQPSLLCTLFHCSLCYDFPRFFFSLVSSWANSQIYSGLLVTCCSNLFHMAMQWKDKETARSSQVLVQTKLQNKTRISSTNFSSAVDCGRGAKKHRNTRPWHWRDVGAEWEAYCSSSIREHGNVCWCSHSCISKTRTCQD